MFVILIIKAKGEVLNHNRKVLKDGKSKKKEFHFSCDIEFPIFKIGEEKIENFEFNQIGP